MMTCPISYRSPDQLAATLANHYRYGPTVTITDHIKGELHCYLNAWLDYIDRVHGVTVFYHSDPLNKALPQGLPDILDSIAFQGLLHIFAGGTDSVWGVTVNRKLRAVHDWHHAQAKAGFDLVGEVQTYTYGCKYPDGLPVSLGLKMILFSEVVMQSATTISTGYYPDQRVVYSAPSVRDDVVAWGKLFSPA